ncbi:MAG: DUF4423 domain-containing protein, partial [Bdellovibrionales bacterium]
LAIQALETVPMSQRDQSSMTMAIDTSLMDAAKEKIKNFRRELCDFFQKENNPRNAVYQLTISLCPLTKIEE